jgi:N-acetylglutamate synthase-like GNAT family acetyltransferase
VSFSLQLRLATPDDANAVSSVLLASYSTIYRGWYRDDVLTRALPAISRANPALLASGRYLIVEAGGRIISCGGWSRDKPGGAPTPKLAHLRHFATHPDHCGKGAAGAVVATSLHGARADGAREIEVLSSLPAEAFYAGHGFKPAAIVHQPVAGAAFACVMMRRAL